MKIAFTTSGENLDVPLDGRFGRAPKFILYDLEKDYFEVIDNRQNLNAAKGKTLDEALALTDEQVAEALGGLPEEKMHCSSIAVGAIHYGILRYISPEVQVR